MQRRVFNALSVFSLLLCVTALLMWAWSPGRMCRLDRGCRYVMYCHGGRLVVVHFDYFSDMRTHGDERDAWGAIAVAWVHLGTMAALTSIIPGLWCYVAVRNRSRIPFGCCLHGGHDLRASEVRCPECGKETPIHAESCSRDRPEVRAQRAGRRE